LVNLEEAQADKFAIEWSWYNIRLATTDSALIKINGNIINAENSVVINTLSTENYDKVNLSLFNGAERTGNNSNYEDDAMDGKYLHILQATVKGWGDYDLIAYLPVPIKRETENIKFLRLEGPTKVIYLSDGNINYYRSPYKMHYAKDEPTDIPPKGIEANWSMLPIPTEYNSIKTYK
jgi:hypothetical protein